MGSCTQPIFDETPPVYLHTITSSMAAPLLPHFFAHYAQLGIRITRRAHVVVHLHNGSGAVEDEARTRAVLASHGIVGDMAIYFTGPYTPQLRDQYVGKFVKQMPQGSWLINADTDEHYVYPCSMGSTLAALSQHSGTNHTVAFCGTMLDRISEDLSLATPSAESAAGQLARQFPRCAHIRRTLDSGKLTKLTLIRPHIQGRSIVFTNAHTAMVTLRNGRRLVMGHGDDPQPDGMHNCESTGPFPHYSYTSVQARLLHLKMVQSPCIGTSWCHRVAYEKELALIRKPGAENGSAPWMFNQKGRKVIEHTRQDCAPLPYATGTAP